MNKSVFACVVFSLMLSGCGGGGSDSASSAATTPTTPTVPAATVAIGVAPASVTVGSSAMVTWSSTNAASCSGTGAWTGAQATSGTLSVAPTAAGQSVYTLTCVNSAGAAQSGGTTLTATAPPAPTVTLSFSAPSVTQGTVSALTWTSTNATACTASGAWSGSKTTTGTLNVSTPAVGAFAYTLACQNAAAVSVSASATLTVTAPPKFVLGASTLITVSGDLASPLASGPVGLMQFADLDGNGWDDLVMTGAYYPSEGSTPVARPGYVAFSGPSGFSASATGPFPYPSMLDVHAREFAFVDLNGDGVRDVFVADHGYDASPYPGFQNHLFLSQGGTATWLDATANLPQLSDFTHSVTTGDVNGDGKMDIFAGNGGLRDAYFLIGNGTGGFTKNSAILPINSGQALENAGVALTSCLLADLDGDGLPELVLGTIYASRANQVLWNVGGSYAGGTITSLPPPANFGTTWLIYDVQATDLNGDGKPDLVVVYQGDVTYGGWYIQFLVNQGNHQFVDQTATYLPDAAAVTSGAVSASAMKSWIAFLLPMDLNGDGRLDYWVAASPVGGQYDDNLPVAMIRQADGHFVPVKVGELKAAGLPAFFQNYMAYARRGASLPGMLMQPYKEASGQVRINAQPITFN